MVNTSGTLPAAVAAGEGLTVHFSTAMPDGDWLIELRAARDQTTVPYGGGVPGQVIELPGGARLHLAARFSQRLWRARLSTAVVPYLLRHGAPIRYSYVARAWPTEAYQTVFATRPGSAEMPSASRPFTPPIVTRLVAGGVMIAPLTLHTGVSSLEGDEDPYPEFYDVPPATARLAALTRASGGRIIAAGTTVVRALESAALAAGGGEVGRRLGLDRARRHAGHGGPGGRRAADRPARTALVAPEDAGRVRGRGPAQPVLRRGAGPRLPLARVRRRPPPPAVARR